MFVPFQIVLKSGALIFRMFNFGKRIIMQFISEVNCLNTLLSNTDSKRLPLSGWKCMI